LPFLEFLPNIEPPPEKLEKMTEREKTDLQNLLANLYHKTIIISRRPETAARVWSTT
jgi:hypothetical protein